MKKLILLLGIILITLTGMTQNRKFGISDFSSRDNWETTISKLDNHYCESITTDTKSKSVEGRKFSYSYSRRHRIQGDIQIFFNDHNKISYIVFHPIFNNKNHKRNQKEFDNYLEYLNEKYFPNVDTDIRWIDKNVTIVRAKNNSFYFSLDPNTLKNKR